MCVKFDDFHAFVYSVLLYIQEVYGPTAHETITKGLYSFKIAVKNFVFVFKNVNLLKVWRSPYATLSLCHFLSSLSSGDSEWIYVYVVAQKTLYCNLPAEPVTQADVFPSTPSPSPSFMMETDTNTVIGFRDKLFTLPMLSAAVSVLRGRTFYKWPFF